MKSVLTILFMSIASQFARLSAQDTKSRFQPQPYVQLQNADWVKNATIYELNVRQFSAKGDFKSVEKDLPRLKKMGIDIIWLMPINPIGKKNRKGTLGSYYSVQDYRKVNPEFGTEEDFRNLVNAIHKAKMHVIIDWVANHSSWDNPLVESHPEWYKKSKKGNFVSTPWRDYNDIVEFDYSQPGLRKYMTEAMKYWVNNFGIDGYRCDVASFVPIDFWESLRTELWAIKPVFMLAESQDRDLHRKAFDATYAWELWNATKKIAQESSAIQPLTEGYITEHIKVFPKEGIRMNFTDNHDKNSWEGNQYKNFGDALPAMTVLMTMMDGMPLVYNGQEAGLARSLKFFEKDPIVWQKHVNEKLYTTLFNLKHKNQALWNGRFGGEMERITNNSQDDVISFYREMNGDKVLTFINLSNKKLDVTFDTSEVEGNYFSLFGTDKTTLTKNFSHTFAPWEYIVFHNSKP